MGDVFSGNPVPRLYIVEQLPLRVLIFAIVNKAKPDTENISLNLAVVRRTPLKVTKLPL
jgi:hypothetical protein